MLQTLYVVIAVVVFLILVRLGHVAIGIYQRLFPASSVKWPIAALVTLALCSITAYAAWTFYQTERNARELENEVIVPQSDHESVTEVGYVIKSSTTRSLWYRKTEIIWSVKIPMTNKVWGCDWEAGFAGFKDNDSVLLIHKPTGGADGVDWEGYLIGMHNEQKNKVARVWVLDVEDMRHANDEWRP